MASRFAEGIVRIFSRVYVCKKCKRKLRADPPKVLLKKVSCRKCGSKYLRPIKKAK